jgi:hypothetical protein
MDAIEREFQESKRNSEFMEAFGFRLQNQFAVNKAYRRPKELEWLESLRQYKGLYDPDVVIAPNNSKVYPKITRSKVNIVLSRLHEMLFPEIDKNWEIEPTPEPRISKEQVVQIAMSLVTQDERGEYVIPNAEELNMAIKDFCDKQCERMSSVIDDQLIEMDYSEETKKVLRSGLLYGTGIMKGPMVGKRTKRKWEPTDLGDFQEAVNTEDVPEMRAIRLWDWYPDMSVTEQENSTGSFERHIMNKHDLRLLMKRDDFYSDMIEKYLKDHPDGDYVPLNWEVDLQVIEIEAGYGKLGNPQFSPTAVTGTTDEPQRATNRQLGKRYEVLEFWGYVDGHDLEACGLTVPNTELEYLANVWLLGPKPIKSTLFEVQFDQYKLFYYEKDETSIFGEGLARIMRHSQIAIAAAARMVLDNAACVAGPQVEVNWSVMTPDTDYSSFYPRKIWYREGKGVDAQYPAIRVYNIDSHVKELLTIVDAFRAFGDEETTLPTWMIGDKVNNETAQATSSRNATVLVSIKDVVKNFDTFTEKIIRDIYAWNMEFNPRPDIKGDFNIRARGVSSLVMKEVRMQALTQLGTTMTPAEWDWVPEGQMVQEKFKAHDLDIKLRTQEEVDKLRQEREQSVQNQLALKMAEAEIGYKKAQTMAQLTKAKEHNVQASVAAQPPPEIPAGQDPRLVDAEVQGAQADVAAKAMDIEAKNAEIRRQEERHALDMVHKDEAHRVNVATQTAKTGHDMQLTDKKAEHDMKMKEHMTKASAEAKKTAAKQKKTASKPSK